MSNRFSSGCSSPTLNITNGFGTFMGTFIRFRCRPGYRLIGAAEIHCRSSFFYTELQTNWSEPFPACSRKTGKKRLHSIC